MGDELTGLLIMPTGVSDVHVISEYFGHITQSGRIQVSDYYNIFALALKGASRLRGRRVV